MNKFIGFLIILILIVAGVYFITKDTNDTMPTGDQVSTTTGQTTDDTQQTTEDATKTIIGKSVEGRDITAYHYGEGDTEILFVGGIHGGYSWNTALVAYEAMDYFEANEDDIPSNVKVTVIPVLNPDGLNKIVGTADRFIPSVVPTAAGATVPGRFNANNVDLNRNFDCEWQSSGTWQSTSVSGGSAAFSEPESLAMKNYVDSRNPSAVVVWYSAAGGVFASNCRGGVLAETTTLTNLYAQASGYRAYQSFDFYEITGDMVNWLAKEGIPGISVLLTNHSSTEWSKNQAGIEALLAYYAD